MLTESQREYCEALAAVAAGSPRLQALVGPADWRALARTVLDALEAHLAEAERSDAQGVVGDAGERLTAFAVAQAGEHARRGVKLEAFLEVAKTIRRTFAGLTGRLVVDRDDALAANEHLHAFFDALELVVCREWGALVRLEGARSRDADARLLGWEKERYHTVFQCMPEPVLVTDDQGHVIDINTACATLLGINPEEARGRCCKDLLGCPVCEGCSLGPPGAREESLGPDETQIRVPGGLRTVRVTSAQIPDRPDGRRESLSILQDITSQKSAEQALRRNERTFRSLFDNMLHGIAHHRIVTDAEGRPTDYVFLEINDAFEAMTGLARADVLGRPVTEVIPGIDRSTFDWIGVYGRVALTGKSISFVQYSPELDHWYAIAAYSTEPEHFTAVFHDITDLKRAQHAAEADRERLTVTLRSIGDGVITTDEEGRVTLLNTVAETLTGFSQAEAVGRPLDAIFHICNEKTRIPCENPVKKVLAHGKVIGLANHTVLISKDGTERAIADSGAPVLDASGAIRGVVLVFRDVTEERRLETEAQRRQQLESLGVLAGGIAHDFNNLLTAMLGNISLARFQSGADARISRLLDGVEKAALRAKALTDQLLTFARGGAPVKKLAPIAEVVRESCTFALRGSRTRCDFDLPDDLWWAEVDVGQLSQVFQNLVINADQAMRDGGDLAIVGRNVHLLEASGLPLPPGTYAVVSVRDQGGGIPRDHLERIFNPYFTTKESGSGLGLAVAHSVMKRHNGHIDVDSEVGVGTTFTVYIPASTESPASPAEHKTTVPVGAGRILLMDDEEIVRQVVRHLLERLGYEVTLTANGSEAVRAYVEAHEAGRPFAAVIMDLTVQGGMGGAEAVKQLLTVDPNVRAIVASGYSNDPVMANFRSFGFRGLVAKPFTVGELGAVLSRVLAD